MINSDTAHQVILRISLCQDALLLLVGLANPPFAIIYTSCWCYNSLQFPSSMCKYC